MAGHGSFSALLDANVLYSIAISDALIGVASTGIYAAKWTHRIDGEWIRHLAENRGTSPEKFHYRRDQMHIACPDWEVPEECWKQFEEPLTLPDPDDRHVLAAAIAGHADCSVTCNLRDFPRAALKPFGLEALHPDEFLHHQLQLDPLVVLPAFKAMRARCSNPSFTPDEFVAAMTRNGLIRTAEFLQAARDLI